MTSYRYKIKDKENKNQKDKKWQPGSKYETKKK